MNRTEKDTFVQTFAQSYQASDAILVVNVDGLTVGQMQSLRTKLRQCDATLKVGKVRLMKIAIRAASGDEALIDSLGRQLGAVFVTREIQETAKQLSDFMASAEQMKFVSGVFKNKFINAEEIKTLASLPSYSVLMTQLAYALNASIAGLARALHEVEKKNAAGSDAVTDQKDN